MGACRALLPLVLLCASPGRCCGLEAGLPRCPEPDEVLKTKGVGSWAVRILFKTDIEDVDLALVWVASDGSEKELQLPTPITPESPSSQDSQPGHAFRVYAKLGEGRKNWLLVHEYQSWHSPDQSVLITNCRELEDALAAKRAGEPVQLQREDRSAEFEALRHPGGEGGGEYPACEPKGQSSRWSCVRRLAADVCEARHKNEGKFAEGSKFGFAQAQGKWDKGAYEDRQFDWQQPRIPRLSSGPGFLVLNMTETLRETLLPWYAAEAKKKKMKVEAPVPGGYINDKQVPMHILNIDKYRQVRAKTVREMRKILEWWTGGTTLTHQSTFGARVYRRGSTLLNHVDRMDTHLASAILQIHQEVDEDGGWPVEVLSEDRDCFEVYLQPGQMVLYEGAHFKHGRPMAFRGEAFANIFTHFTPEGWTGISSQKEL